MHLILINLSALKLYYDALSSQYICLPPYKNIYRYQQIFIVSFTVFYLLNMNN